MPSEGFSCHKCLDGSDQLMEAGDETLYKCIHLPINPWIIRHYCHFITWTCH